MPRRWTWHRPTKIHFRSSMTHWGVSNRNRSTWSLSGRIRSESSLRLSECTQCNPLSLSPSLPLSPLPPSHSLTHNITETRFLWSTMNLILFFCKVMWLQELSQARWSSTTWHIMASRQGEEREREGETEKEREIEREREWRYAWWWESRCGCVHIWAGYYCQLLNSLQTLFSQIVTTIELAHTTSPTCLLWQHHSTYSRINSHNITLWHTYLYHNSMYIILL